MPGIKGRPGRNGDNGEIGAQGVKGNQGPRGSKGSPGNPGVINHDEVEVLGTGRLKCIRQEILSSKTLFVDM